MNNNYSINRRLAALDVADTFPTKDCCSDNLIERDSVYNGINQYIGNISYFKIEDIISSVGNAKCLAGSRLLFKVIMVAEQDIGTRLYNMKDNGYLGTIHSFEKTKNPIDGSNVLTAIIIRYLCEPGVNLNEDQLRRLYNNISTIEELNNQQNRESSTSDDYSGSISSISSSSPSLSSCSSPSLPSTSVSVSGNSSVSSRSSSSSEDRNRGSPNIRPFSTRPNEAPIDALFRHHLEDVMYRDNSDLHGEGNTPGEVGTEENNNESNDPYFTQNMTMEQLDAAPPIDDSLYELVDAPPKSIWGMLLSELFLRLKTKVLS